jgi:hypothetical protein
MKRTPEARQTEVAFRSKQRAQRAIMFLGEDPCGLTAALPPAIVKMDLEQPTINHIETKIIAYLCILRLETGFQ